MQFLNEITIVIFTGMDPSIPGFPRYEVVGNLDLGEYNLMITNVELGDDAEYQCQVMPSRGNGALMASAYLTVHSTYCYFIIS